MCSSSKSFNKFSYQFIFVKRFGTINYQKQPGVGATNFIFYIIVSYNNRFFHNLQLNNPYILIVQTEYPKGIIEIGMKRNEVGENILPYGIRSLDFLKLPG